MSQAEFWSEGGWIDISRPLRAATPVWPGDRPFELNQQREPGLVLSSFSTTCHVGTHVDAPLHFDDTAEGIEGVPIDRCVGPAEVLFVPSAGRVLVPGDLPEGWEPSLPRVLLRTDSHPMDGEIADGITGLSAELVHWLADRGVEMLGVDSPSVDVFTSEDLPAHHALLERGLTWVEGLLLGQIPPGKYLLIALPILLEGAEAAPVRALLKPMP